MKKGTVFTGVLLAAVFSIVAAAAGASEFDRAMEPILAEYLKIQGRFKHLTGRESARIQEMVDEEWEMLKGRV